LPHALTWLHELVGSLPEAALAVTQGALEHFQSWPPDLLEIVGDDLCFSANLLQQGIEIEVNSPCRNRPATEIVFVERTAGNQNLIARCFDASKGVGPSPRRNGYMASTCQNRRRALGSA